MVDCKPVVVHKEVWVATHVQGGEDQTLTHPDGRVEMGDLVLRQVQVTERRKPKLGEISSNASCSSNVHMLNQSITGHRTGKLCITGRQGTKQWKVGQARQEIADRQSPSSRGALQTETLQRTPLRRRRSRNPAEHLLRRPLRTESKRAGRRGAPGWPRHVHVAAEVQGRHSGERRDLGGHRSELVLRQIQGADNGPMREVSRKTARAEVNPSRRSPPCILHWQHPCNQIVSETDGGHRVPDSVFGWQGS
mmetsp:Transcript_74321/g.170420  ORF Transcript_74321/g.170420 Transcript_74321/m.170420 type:complete len:250 (+) Transcript_74321:1641-2390(+)